MIILTNYSLKEILTNDNLIFDLKYDCTFKRVFLNEDNIDFLALIISKIKAYDYNELLKKLKIGNNELSPNKSNNKSNYTDLVCKLKNKNIIFEMNNFYTSVIMYKNNYYLFKQHTSKSNNKNMYGKYNKTILINFDNYDILGMNELIYTSKMTIQKYYKCIYNNIEIININLAYLRKKYYNKEELNELEKLLLIFIEQDKTKLREIVKYKEVERIIEYMDRLKFEEGYVVTYDKEELDKMVKEEFEMKMRRLEKRQKKLEKREEECTKKMNKINKDINKITKARDEISKDRDEISKDRDEISKDRDEISKDRDEIRKDKDNFVKDKINFAKELKEYGTPIEKIIQITKLSLEQIEII